MFMQLKNQTPAPAILNCDDTPLWDLLMTVYHLPVLTVANEIGLFSRLEQAPATPEEIASHLSLNVPGTTALLNALTALALLEQRQGKFYLTQTARHFLLPESPYYWGDVLRLQQHVRPETIHAALHRAVRREQPVSGGQSLWDRQAQDPATAYAFVRAMHNVSFPTALGVAHRGDFTGVTRLLDVGGGSGCFSIALATRYPHMGFTVMDLPAICPLAELPDDFIARYGLALARTRDEGLVQARTELLLAQTAAESKLETAYHDNALYRLAGLAALEGRIEAALAQLRQAITLSNEPAEVIRHDPAWDDLRADPRFQALLV
jgi:hypothetical protein